MEKILDGKALAKKIRENLKLDVDILKSKGIAPKLAVIMVGSDPASQIYVKNKSKAAEEIGIEYEEYLLDENIKMDELLLLINKLNNSKEIHGILVQSPMPKGLDINEAIKAISPLKDVDGFHPINVGKLILDQDCLMSCTPFGIIKLLEEYNITLEGKHAVVVGRSNIVGKPMAMTLINKDATVTVCHSKTINLPEITRQADILICAVGKPKFITEDMVKAKAVVVDVGINRGEDGKITGDVDFEKIYEKASYITPVPGGVGPMTVAMLMNNVVKAADVGADSIRPRRRKIMELIMGLVDFILHFDKYLGGFIADYGAWVYGILFTIIFCETGLVFTPFLPGDSLLFAAGTFAAIGSMNYFFLLSLLIVAAILGDSVNYFIGRKFGEKIISSTKLIKPKHLEKSEAFIKKHGGKSLILARFMPIVRTVVPFLLGMGKMEYGKFLRYNIIGGVVWVSIFLTLGYFFGNVPFVRDNLTIMVLGIIFVSVLPIGIGMLKGLLQKRR